MTRALALIVLLAAPAALAAGDHAAAARALVEAMGHGDFAAVVKQLSPEVAKALDAGKLGEAWKLTVGDLGPFVAVDSVRVEAGEKVIARARLAKATVDVWFRFNAADQVAGLHFDRPDSWTAPAYVDGAKFEERAVVVGAPGVGLPGTLAVPKGKGPFPALFLVHGSGPQDRDESMPGGARPFRDLARGLASRGVVVLRYEKRTYSDHYKVLGVPAGRVTIKEEYLIDVAGAAALLRATKEVDPKRIYVLGHSEGGFLVPKFLASDPALAGAVILAGTARRFEDILVPQYEYLDRMSGDPRAGLVVDDLRKKIVKVKSPTLSESTPASELPLGLPASYWLSVRGYDPPEVARALPQPLLILQGERDYQVTPAEDFALWKKELAKKKNVKYVLYPKLNHLFFAGEGPIGPDEYLKKSGHVDAKVIADIAAFTR